MRKLKAIIVAAFGVLSLAALGVGLAGCGEETSTETSFEHEHEYEWVLKKPASCTQEGTEVQKCKLCLEEGETRTVAKTAHSYQYITITRSTCTTEGTEKAVCSVCGAEGETRESALAPHTVGEEWEFDEALGLHYKTCSVCGERTSLGEHHAESYISSSTGHYKLCEDCGARFAEEAHSTTSDEWQHDAEEGIHFHVCDACSTRMDVTVCVPASAAYEVDETTDRHYQTCAVCMGRIREGEHEKGIRYKSQDGMETHYLDCTVCGKILSEEAHNFSEASVIVHGSCTEQNTCAAVCLDCGTRKTWKEGYTHGETDVWYKEGNGHYQICPLCKQHFNVSEHTYEYYWVEGDQHGGLCVCGERGAGTPHTYVPTPRDAAGHDEVCVCGASHEGQHTLAENVSEMTYGCTACGYVLWRFAEAGDGYAARYVGTGLSEITVPETFAGKNVTVLTKIADPDVQKVNLPANLREIGERAFAGTSVCRVTLPSATAKIGQGAFAGCTYLNGVVIRSGSSLPEDLFDGCTALKWVVLPQNLKEIGVGAFNGCDLLSVYFLGGTGEWQNVTGGSSLAEDADVYYYSAQEGTATEWHWVENTNDSEPEGWNATLFQFSTIGGNLYVTGYLGTRSKVELPKEHDGVKVNGVYTYALDGLSFVTEITIPDTYQYLWGHAFSGTSITEITIPESVETLSFCITDCSKLTKVNWNATKVTELPNYFLKGTAVTEFTIPDYVTQIGWNCFEGTKLKRIVIGKNIEKIWHHAFKDTSAEIVWETEHITELSQGLFSGWTGSSFTIGDNVTYIWDECFMGCSNLTSIEIPSSVTYIGSSAFRGTGIKDVVVPALNYIGSYVFADCPNLRTAVVGNCSKPNPSYSGLIIGVEHLFENCPKLETLKIGNGWQSISDTFKNCPKLRTVEVGDGIYDLGGFEGTDSLERILIKNPKRLNFYDCDVGAIKVGTKICVTWGYKNNFYEDVVTKNDNSVHYHLYFYSEGTPPIKNGIGGFWHYDSKGTGVENILFW